jgi:hypothetical protein
MSSNEYFFGASGGTEPFLSAVGFERALAIRYISAIDEARECHVRHPIGLTRALPLPT